ncbi:hypothetical protein FQR65_LT02123 [Abscondita terminalis]|nr:hypothetical protein FQR65_LT02123 [Abscondita terminalis]
MHGNLSIFRKNLVLQESNPSKSEKVTKNESEYRSRLEELKKLEAKIEELKLNQKSIEQDQQKFLKITELIKRENQDPEHLINVIRTYVQRAEEYDNVKRNGLSEIASLCESLIKEHKKRNRLKIDINNQKQQHENYLVQFGNPSQYYNRLFEEYNNVIKEYVQQSNIILSRLEES